jgi:hypothetical protein
MRVRMLTNSGAKGAVTGVHWITLKDCEDPALKLGTLVSG